MTPQQWEAAAADHGISVDELHVKIASLDSSAAERLAAHYHLEPLYFDREGEPLTLGEWAHLYESRSYKYLAQQVLPNRYWIATIWHGVNEDFADPPVVLETSVFHLSDSTATLLPPACYRLCHTTEHEAFETHRQLVTLYSKASSPVQDLDNRTL